MAKADPPKKDKPKYGTAAATGAGYGVMSGAKKAKAGFKTTSTQTNFYKNKVPRTFKYIDNEGRTAKAFAEATQRVTTTKSFSKLGVVTKSTLTETVDGMRQSTRSTTLSPRGKLKGLGQVVIQETKGLEKAGKGYTRTKLVTKPPYYDKFFGKTWTSSMIPGEYTGSYVGEETRRITKDTAKQGGKSGGKGKYTTKSITYAKEGYPTPKRGRVPKAGNPVVSKLDRVTNLTGKMVSYTDDYGSKTVLAETKTKNIYKTLVSPQTRAGQYIQSKSAAQLFSAASGAAKVAGKIIGAGNIVGTAVLAYDAMKWAQQWHQDNPNYNKEKYKNYSYNK
jgi:hypothetical protein